EREGGLGRSSRYARIRGSIGLHRCMCSQCRSQRKRVGRVCRENRQQQKATGSHGPAVELATTSKCGKPRQARSQALSAIREASPNSMSQPIYNSRTRSARETLICGLQTITRLRLLLFATSG